MRAGDESREAPVLLTLGEYESEHERVRESWDKFDSAACKCYNKNDKKRLARGYFTASRFLRFIHMLSNLALATRSLCFLGIYSW